MKTACGSTVRYLLLPDKTSPSPYLTPIDEKAERAYLLQRIELLEMENQELKRRDENNKKINLALTQTIAKASHQPEDIKQIIAAILQAKPQEVSVKQVHHQESQTEFQSVQHFESLYSTYRNQSNPQDHRYSHAIKSSSKGSFLRDEEDNSNKYLDCLDHYESRFNKNKSPQARNLNLSSFVNECYGTPVRSKRATPQKQKGFQRTQSYFEGPSTHRSSVRQGRGRNVATDLLCDICGVSFSPMIFLAHVQECEGDNSFSEDLRKITDADFSEEEDTDGSQQLVEMLENRKKKLSAQIEKLKKIRGTPERKKKLETDLDQIVFIIKNKKTLNSEDIKRLLKQKNYYERYFR